MPSLPVPEKDPPTPRPSDAGPGDTVPRQTPLAPAGGDTLIGPGPAMPPADPPPPPPASPPPPPPSPAGPPPGMSIGMILGIFGLVLVGLVLLAVGIFAVARLTAPSQVAALTATATPISLPTNIVVIPTTTLEPTATITPTPEPTATAAPPTATAIEANPGVSDTPTGSATVLTIISGANVRSGPGTEYEVIGGIKEGDSVPVFGISAGGGWYAIDFGSALEGRAWVSAQVATFPGSDSDLPLIAAPPQPAATATTKPANNPAPGPLAGTHGVSGQLRMCGGKLNFAVNERVCFIEWIKNTTAAPVSYGVLGVQAVSLSGGGTKFQTSWDANAVPDGFLWIDPGCIGPTDRCNGEWEDGLRLPSAGNWRLTLTVCFSDFTTCLNAGDWEALSIPITVAVN